MPPKQKKAPELIKGQSSLAGFFSNGRLAAVEPAAPAAARASGSSSASPAKSAKSASPKKPKAPAGPAPPVEQLTEKITVAGYRPSASASPSPNKKTAAAAAPPAAAKKPAPPPPADDPASDEEMAPPAGSAAKPSKYFAAESGSGQSSGKNAANAIDLDDSEDDIPVAHAKRAAPKSSSSSAKAAPKRKAASDSDSSDFEPAKPVSKARKSSAASTPTKARGGKSAAATASKSKAQPIELSDDDDDDDAGPSKPKASASKKAKKEKGEDGEKEVPAWIAAAKRRAEGPAAAGSKEIPVGKPNCLAGLAFVFTGELSSLSRDDATKLAKRYGGKVTGAPSSKTSYVVLGSEPGPSKITAIKKNNLKTLDEDGFLALIAARGESAPDPDVAKKQAAEVAKYKKAAAEMLPKATKNAPAPDYSSALWTAKYAPRALKDLVGNNGQIAKMQDWLENWDRSLASGFKKPGKHAIGTHRALLISGPPGIGKTSAAHLVAKLAGFNPIELNASDTRSKKLIESSLKETINNTSLDGWYHGGQAGMDSDTIRITDRTCLIMDEVDGMSGGDRGGVGAINVLIRKTKVPIICICNDAKTPKMKPLESTCAALKFTRPDARTIRARMMSIAFREKMKITPEAMDQLVEAAQADIRLVINMLSTWNLSKKTMDFDEGQAMGAANMKPGMHTPFSLYSALSAPGMFSATNSKTLNEKSEYYFNDHSIMPLMVQTNYIHQRPVIAGRYSGPEQAWKTMDLMTKAAVSISDGDMIDSMIHGPQQQWSLMPLHAIASCVRPMSHVFGQSNAGNGYGPGFPTWLGMNSKQQRLSRAAVELQARMRLAASGSRFEVREQYLPYFVSRLTAPLIENGQSGIPEVISFMDDYYLGLEDRDNILELGIGDNHMDGLLKKIPSAVKSSFTRQYNGADHPIAFYKGDASAGKIKKLKGEPAPDVLELEGAEDDTVGDISDAESASSGGELDLKKDKMVKAKKKPAAKGKGKAKAKA